MLYLEIQEGKESMQYKEYVVEMKAQAACTNHLAVASTFSSKSKEEGEEGDKKGYYTQ